MKVRLKYRIDMMLIMPSSFTSITNFHESLRKISELKKKESEAIDAKIAAAKKEKVALEAATKKNVGYLVSIFEKDFVFSQYDETLFDQIGKPPFSASDGEGGMFEVVKKEGKYRVELEYKDACGIEQNYLKCISTLKKSLGTLQKFLNADRDTKKGMLVEDFPYP